MNMKTETFHENFAKYATQSNGGREVILFVVTALMSAFAILAYTAIAHSFHLGFAHFIFGGFTFFAVNVFFWAWGTDRMIHRYSRWVDGIQDRYEAKHEAWRENQRFRDC